MNKPKLLQLLAATPVTVVYDGLNKPKKRKPKKKIFQLLAATPVTVVYDNGDGNSNDAYVPEHWAMESLMILDETMVTSKLVHRDFSAQVQQMGDVVNTRRPRKFKSTRKTDRDCVVDEDAISDNVRVPLDQHWYKTFVIKDGELSLSFKDLVSIYLAPAIQSVGRGVDRSVIGQAHRFMDRPAVGRLGGLSAANAQDQLVEAHEKLTMANVPMSDRRLVLSPISQSAFLKTEQFVSHEKADTTEGLRDARINRLFNFDLYGAVNTPCVSDTSTDFVSGTVTNAVAASAAAVSQAVSIVGYEAQPGDYVVVSGNDQPQYVLAAVTAGGDTTAVTLNSANKYSTIAGAEIKIYSSVTAVTAYGQGYSKEISVAGSTNAIMEGRMISVGSGSGRKTYTVVESCPDPLNSANQLLLLDRPLDAGIALGERMFPGTAGCYNLAFHKNALAFVTRPLATPPSEAGVKSAVVNWNGLSIRITMQYDMKCQGTRVTCDLLTGVALLDAEMACLFLG